MALGNHKSDLHNRTGALRVTLAQHAAVLENRNSLLTWYFPEMQLLHSERAVSQYCPVVQDDAATERNVVSQISHVCGMCCSPAGKNVVLEATFLNCSQNKQKRITKTKTAISLNIANSKRQNLFPYGQHRRWCRGGRRWYTQQEMLSPFCWALKWQTIALRVVIRSR